MKEFLKGEHGSQIVEFGLLILPLFGFLFLVMNICWVIFAQASLQHAVREGVRFAVTGQLKPGYKHQDDEIRAVVEASSMGFVTAAEGASKISIQYYDASTLKTLSGSGSNAGGNLVQITISNVRVSPLAAVFGESALQLGASSADVMESSPGGIPPPR